MLTSAFTHLTYVMANRVMKTIVNKVMELCCEHAREFVIGSCPNKSRDKCWLLDVAQTCLRKNQVRNEMDYQEKLVVHSENEKKVLSPAENYKL